jgi:transposase InsO family protein
MYDRKIRKRVVVPAALRPYILSHHHDLPITAHLGVKKTMSILARRFYWPHMKETVIKKIKGCELCERRKTPRPKAGLTSPILSPYPFHTIGIDIVGKLPETNNGDRYLLTVIDHFTRWPIAIPIPNRKVGTIADALHRHVFMVHSCPKIMHSDREASFTSKILTKVCERLGIRKIHTTGWQPSANGIIERFHRYLGAALTMFVDEFGSDWDKYLASALFAYRTSTNMTTTYSPFELMYGRQPNLPIDNVLNISHNAYKDEAEYFIHISTSLTKAYNHVREAQQRMAAQNAIRRDKGRYEVYYEVGDPVLVWGPQGKKTPKGFDPHPKKFQKRWSKPVLITSKVSNLHYNVQVKPNKEPKIIHVNRLRHYNAWDDDISLTPPDPTSSDDEEQEPGQVTPQKAAKRKRGRPRKNQPDPAHLTPPTRPTVSRARAGDMVAIPSTQPDLPVCIGKVITRGDQSLTIQWYGNRNNILKGTYRPGWLDRSSMAYYNEKPKHYKNKKYTNTWDPTNLNIILDEHIIAHGFSLLSNDKIPATVWNLLHEHKACEYKNPPPDDIQEV